MRTATLVTVLALFAPIARAQPIDVSNDSITCKTVFGVASVTPALLSRPP